MRKRAFLHKKSILWKILLLLLAAMVLQFVLLYGSLFFGGAIDQLRNNAFDILNERIVGRRNNLEDDMIQRWSNLGDSALAIDHEIDSLLAEQHAVHSNLVANSQLSSDALDAASERLFYLLRRNSVTGVFLIFNGDQPAEYPANGEQQVRAGIYLRDSDPDSNPEDYSDLMMERCPSALGKQLGITFGTIWQPQFTFSENTSNDYFYKPYQAAIVSGDAEPSDLGYWCPAFFLEDDATSVITYSQPLINDDGMPYGIIGVELSEDYLVKQLPYSEINGDKQGSYLIAVNRESGDGLLYEDVISSGPYYTRIFGNTSKVRMSGDPVRGDCYLIDSNGRIDDKAYGCIKPLQLYNTNTPFEKEQWALIGVIEENDLLRLFHSIQSFILLTLLAVFVIGVGSAFLVSFRFAKPITSLAQKVRESDPQNPVQLGKINIAEIDELSSSIEDLSHNVAAFSSKLTTIMQMAGYQIGAFEWRVGSRHIFFAGDFFKVLGIPEEEGRPDLHNVDVFQEIMEKFSPYLESESKEDKTRIYHLVTEDGRSRWVRLKLVESETSTLGVVSDITAEATERKMIEYERDYDLLTNLLNRRAFHSLLNKKFQERDELQIAAIVMIDLDNLKYINDTYGHDCGDQYIRCAADVLRTYSSPTVTVARMSGDEFFIFLESETRDEIYTKLHRLEESFHQARMRLPDGEEIKVRLSAGIAWYPDDAETFQQLIRYADFAMYRVKHTTKGEFAEFDLTNYNRESYLLSNKEELNKLIDEELITYQFQPIVNARTGEIFAYEALMRPLIPAFQSPLDVLMMARSQSKLYQIERLTFFKAFEMVAKLSKKEDSFRIFVNSIPNQPLSDKDLQELGETYQYYLPRLVLELTEEEKLDESLTRKKQSILKKWGAEVALDDFGAGYNGDSTLLFVQPKYIKVDKMIIRSIDQDEKRLVILQGILTYARSHDAYVIAEGVETKEELETLIASGVDFLQGFYVCRPQNDFCAIPVERRDEIIRLYQKYTEQ